MNGDPLPNLLAVLRALTAPEDGDEHPFLRDAAKLDQVYLNPLGVAARIDGVRAQWSTFDGFEAIEILTARDLWPLAGIEPDVARLHRVKARRPGIDEVLSIAAQGRAAYDAVQVMRSLRGPKLRTVTLFEPTCSYDSDLVPLWAYSARRNAALDPLSIESMQEHGVPRAGLFFFSGYCQRDAFAMLLYPGLVHHGKHAGRAIAQSLRAQVLESERSAA